MKTHDTRDLSGVTLQPPDGSSRGGLGCWVRGGEVSTNIQKSNEGWIIANINKTRKAFAEKIVVVTGGTSGIGSALCRTLGDAGAIVIVTGRNIEKANEIVSQINDKKGRAYAHKVDVTVEGDIDGLINSVIAEHGRIDYMFNNAGVGILGEARHLETEHWKPSIDVNLWGVIYGTNNVYKTMVKQGFGHIINISSIQGIVPFAWSTPYVASKHAVYGYSMALRAEGKDLGVKISVVCPEGVESNW